MAIRRGLLELITHTSGGDPIPAGIEIGVFEVDSNSFTHTVNHSLGAIPKIALVINAINGNFSKYDSYSDGSALLYEALGVNPATGEYDNSADTNHKIATGASYNKQGPSYYGITPHTTYPASMTETSVTFVTGRYYNVKFVAGEKYLYILMK